MKTFGLFSLSLLSLIGIFWEPHFQEPLPMGTFEIRQLQMKESESGQEGRGEMILVEFFHAAEDQRRLQLLDRPVPRAAVLAVYWPEPESQAEIYLGERFGSLFVLADQPLQIISVPASSVKLKWGKREFYKMSDESLGETFVMAWQDATLLVPHKKFELSWAHVQIDQDYMATAYQNLKAFEFDRLSEEMNVLMNQEVLGATNDLVFPQNFEHDQLPAEAWGRFLDQYPDYAGWSPSKYLEFWIKRAGSSDVLWDLSCSFPLVKSMILAKIEGAYRYSDWNTQKGHLLWTYESSGPLAEAWRITIGDATQSSTAHFHPEAWTK